MWRGAKETATFYRFWRVRLALHVTAKGIYIPGFCTLTFIYSFIHTYIHTTIYSCISVITSYHLHTFNRLLLHLIIVYPLLVCVLLYYFIFIYAFASCSIAWFPGIVLVGFLLAEVRPPTISKDSPRKILLLA
jgi:hypothetical protein